jgi:hypothetical protein
MHKSGRVLSPGLFYFHSQVIKRCYRETREIICQLHAPDFEDHDTNGANHQPANGVDGIAVTWPCVMETVTSV